MNSQPKSRSASTSTVPATGSLRYSWAIQRGNFKGPQMAILKAIALHFRPGQERAWVSEQGLADETGLNYKTIGPHRRALIARGLLRVVATRHIRANGSAFERPFNGNAVTGDDLRRAGGTPVYELDLAQIEACCRTDEASSSSRRRSPFSTPRSPSSKPRFECPPSEGDAGSPQTEDLGEVSAGDGGPPSLGEEIEASRKLIETEPTPLTEQAPSTVQSRVLEPSGPADAKRTPPPTHAPVCVSALHDPLPIPRDPAALGASATPLVPSPVRPARPSQRTSPRGKASTTESRKLAEAFAAGHHDAGDPEYGVPHYKQDFEALKAIVRSRGEGRQGDVLLAWLRDATAEFARARTAAGDGARYWAGGHGPRGLEEWLNDKARRTRSIIRSGLQQQAKAGQYNWMDGRNLRRTEISMNAPSAAQGEDDDRRLSRG